MKKKFPLLTLALYCLILVPQLTGSGMFLDGVIYSSIARNIADGIGSFWASYYNDIFGPIFYEHPPLGFWFQSWFYKIFGDSFLIDRFYGFSLGLGILYSLSVFIQKVQESQVKSKIPQTMGGPLILLLMPIFSWSIANNMLENLMTLFVVLASILLMMSVGKSLLISTLYAMVSGILLGLSCLSKNPSGLFPLAGF